MSVLMMRRAAATGTAPEEVFLQVAPSFTTTSELAAGARGLRQSLEGIDAPLGALLSRPGVTNVLVNSSKGAWIDAGHGLEYVGDFHLDPVGSSRQMAVRTAAAAGQCLGDAALIVDTTLPPGVRLHAVLPPLPGASTVLSSRVPALLAINSEQLIASGVITSWLAEVLGRLAQDGVSGLVTGTTGTGKTTLLVCLLGLIDPGERLICIKEVSELRPNHPHVVHLQACKDNVQGAGGISLSDLAEAATRMRPGRLILGEARGPEVREMLSALNTGYRGGWATIHANSAVEVPVRLETPGALTGMSHDTVCAQALSVSGVVVHLRRFQVGNERVRRQVVQLAWLCHNAHGELTTKAVLEIGVDGVVRGFAAWSEFAVRLGLPARIPSDDTGFDAGAGGAASGVNGAGDTPSSAGGSGGIVGCVKAHEGIALGRRRLDG